MSGRPNSHVPIRTKRAALDSYTLPLGRNETIEYRLNRPLSRDEAVRPRDGAWGRPLRRRPLNRDTLNNLALLTVPQRATDYPEQPVERSDQESQTGHEECDARVDNEPFHREVEEAAAATATTRGPVLGAHAARVVEGPGERDAITKTHFRSNLSCQVGWYVIVGLCNIALDDVNVVLLQHLPDLLNIIHIHASNTNATLNLAVTVLNDLELKSDTVQTENDLPAQ